MTRTLVMTTAAVALVAVSAVTASAQLFGNRQPQVDESIPIGYCPEVDIEAGHELYAVYEGAQESARLRYQATITSTARECRVVNGLATFTIGLQGRIIAGPRGGGGSASAPVRIAIIYNGSQVAWTQTYSASASLAAPNYGGPFYVVAENIALPIPPVDTTVEIVVGFASN